jgi:peptidoglycan/xylan/chitin deacetylase (PgdA/CDA1 family)
MVNFDLDRTKRCFSPSNLEGNQNVDKYANELKKVNEIKNSKIAYLTFDDGPSRNNTLKILKILNDEKVKATFFVVGNKVNLYPDIVKKLDESGMSIAAHSYSHNYSEIYKSVESFMNDINRCRGSIAKVTKKKNCQFIRFPGGSDNKVSRKSEMQKIRNEILKNNIYYVDWNVCCGDAEGLNVPAYKIKERVINQCKNKDIAVILMHDSYYKDTTVEALPDIIKYLKSEGYIFRTFDHITQYEKVEMIVKEILNRNKTEAVQTFYSKAEMVEPIHNNDEDSKTVFLTFDDGPSINNTLKILDILKQNDIKATFFVIGEKAEEYPHIVKQLHKDGMCIATHTYCHDMNKIYKNAESFMKDKEKCDKVIKNLIHDNTTSYMRMPCGSYNYICNKAVMQNIIDELNRNNIDYVDWNVSSGDSLGRNIDVYKLRNNVLKQCKNKKMIVMLMHDAYYNKTTVDVLPEVIKYLKDEGFKFKTFNEISHDEKEYLIKQKIINRDKSKKNPKAI